MATVGDNQVLQFVPFQSTLDAGFWYELGRRKLEKYQLSEAPVDLQGYYTNNSLPGLPTSLSLDYGAFEESPSLSNLDFPSHGILRNTNTIDGFKNIDKKEILEKAGREIWDAINDGSAIHNPSLLTNFVLLTYANLKKYDYYYWFGYPALAPNEPVSYKSLKTIDKAFTSEQIISLLKGYDKFESENRNIGFFLVQQTGDQFDFQSLSSFEEVYKNSHDITIGFCDPSTLETNPGWPLRNLLFLLGQAWGDRLNQVNVLCYRDCTRKGKRQIGHSLYVEGVTVPGKQDPSIIPKVIGWERNEKNKLAPRFVNLSANMDPKRLAESAVDLNLKLMRWRILPSLDLPTIEKTRCLLLGAGTLGCNVARCLLGWGIRKITLVDSSKVSYSNPVRQTLFNFEDCKNGGAKKAQAAAESLKKIFPGVDAEGVQLLIPMPGHSIGSEPAAVEEVREDVKKLEELIKTHDAVFLLMDTRESRWLPTLMCAAYSKQCINAALGFDTFMVMRHAFFPPAHEGLEPVPKPKLETETRIPGSELGCYFCNDVVAPTDSTRDRTLDQQCTVSRPGLSMVASAIAVELLISVLQHSEKGLAPADSNAEQDDTDTDSPLGLVPHQIRGFLARFHNVLPASQRFDKCTACSDIVISSFKSDGFEFLLKVFNSPNFLEDLTGLSQLYAETLDDHVWELSDDEI